MPTVTLATIQELIVAGRIIEARTLLAVDDSLLNPEERDACLLEIDKRQGQAEELVARAEVMEQSGRSEEARVLYVSVLERATDFPGIQEHIKRMDEALFLARAAPRRPASRLTRDEWARLAGAVRHVLRRAILSQGESAGAGRGHERRVYGCEGEPCRRCRGPVRRVVLAGRSAHFCPRCQR